MREAVMLYPEPDMMKRFAVMVTLMIIMLKMRCFCSGDESDIFVGIILKLNN